VDDRKRSVDEELDLGGRFDQRWNVRISLRTVGFAPVDALIRCGKHNERGDRHDNADDAEN
jgi:hypothetical protein